MVDVPTFVVRALLLLDIFEKWSESTPIRWPGPGRGLHDLHIFHGLRNQSEAAQHVTKVPPPMPCQHSGASPAEFAAKPLIVARNPVDNVRSEQRLLAGAGRVLTVKSVAKMLFGERAGALHVVEPHVVNHHQRARFQERMEQPQIAEDI